MKIWEPKTPGALWATPGLLRDCFDSIQNLTKRFRQTAYNLVNTVTELRRISHDSDLDIPA